MTSYDVVVVGGGIAGLVAATRASELGLKPGRDVIALVKSTEVSIATL